MKIWLSTALMVVMFVNSNAQTVINGLRVPENFLNKESIDGIFNHAKNFPEKTQFSIAIIQDNTVNFYGFVHVGDSIINTDNAAHIFEIGSITKVFTSTLLAQAVIDSTLKLDDVIPVDMPDSIKLTFKQLANQTSGLPVLPSNLDLSTVDENDPYADYDESKLKQYLEEQVVLSGRPGEQYEYSNLGVGLLGYAMSNVYQTTYENALQEYVFKKYGMANSSTEEKRLSSPKVSGLNVNGEEIPYWHFDALAGAGAILSSAKDLSNFAMAQLNESNEVLSLTRKESYRINEQMSIGLGWHLIKTGNGNTWHWHNGGTGGFSSSMALDIENKQGVIILSNVSAFHEHSDNIDALCFALLSSL